MRYPDCSTEELSLLSRAGGADTYRGTNAELALMDEQEVIERVGGWEVSAVGTLFTKARHAPQNVL